MFVHLGCAPYRHGDCYLWGEGDFRGGYLKTFLTLWGFVGMVPTICAFVTLDTAFFLMLRSGTRSMGRLQEE